MKRLLLTLLCVLFAYPCFAAEPIQLARMNPWVAGSVAATSITYTDCSQIPSGAAFVWYGDYASDTDKACYGSTATDGTLGAGISVVDSNTDPGTASPTSGGKVLKFDSVTNEYVQWTNTDNAIFDLDEGRFQIDVYAASSTGYTTIPIVYSNVNNYMNVRFSADGTLRLDRQGNSTRIYVDSTAKLSDTTWTRIRARWSVTANKMAVKIGDNAWQEATGTVAANNSAPTVLMPNCSSYTDTIYMDNIITYTSYSED